MKKTLFLAAVMVAVSAAYGETSSLTSIAAGDITVTGDTFTQITAAGDFANLSAENDATFVKGNGRYGVNADTNLSNAGTIVLASANLDGSTTPTSAGQIFVDMWGKSGITIANKLILGETGYSEGATYSTALRLHESRENNKIVLTGEIQLAQDSKIAVNHEHNYIEGSISGAGKTLTLTNGGATPQLHLSGGATLGGIDTASGVAVTLDATKSDGSTAAAATSYTIGTVSGNNLTVNDGVTLTVTDALHGTVTNNGTMNITGSVVDVTATGTQEAPTTSNGFATNVFSHTLVSGNNKANVSVDSWTFNGVEAMTSSYDAATGILSGTTLSSDYYIVNAAEAFDLTGASTLTVNAAAGSKTNLGAGDITLTGLTVTSGDIANTGSLTVNGATKIQGNAELHDLTTNSMNFVKFEDEAPQNPYQVSLSGTNLVKGELDLSMSQKNYTTLLVKEDSTLTHNGNLWMGAQNEGVILEKDASLVKSNVTITGLDGNGSVKRSSGEAIYATDNTGFTITNAEMTFTNTADSTLTNKLVDTVVNGGVAADGTYKTTVGKNGGAAVLDGATLKNVNIAYIMSDEASTGTITLDGAKGFFAAAATMGDINLGEGGLTTNNGFSKTNLTDATKIAHLGTVNDGKATWTFEGNYGATDLFTVDSVSDKVSLKMNRSTNKATTIYFNNISLGKTASVTQLDDVTVNQGNLVLHGDAFAANTLTMAGGTLSVQALTDTTAADITTSAMTVTNNATLNGNLVLADDATINFVDGTVTLNGSIDFGTGSVVTLGTAYNEALAANGHVLLFQGVTDILSDLSTVAVTGNFSGGYLYSIKQGNNTYNIYATPEPATATLSLLALAGLMARRKRH